MTASDPQPARPVDAALVADRYRDLIDRMALTQDSVGRGAGVDLTPLQFEIQGLCEAVEHLPQPQAKSLEPILVQVIRALDSLAADLRARHDGPER